MISAFAFVPQAPVLVPQLARDAAGELAELRAACRSAIRRLPAPGRQLVVLGCGGGERDTFYDSTSRGSLAGFGLDLDVGLGSDEPGPAQLPPALTVGAWLLRDALGPGCGAVGLGIDGESPAGEPWDGWFGGDADLAVLAVGDGSARRGVTAPGYLDDRAAGYDATVGHALRSGDPAALRTLAPALGAELLAAGAPVWRRVGELLDGPQLGGTPRTGWRGEVLHESDPYGVAYVVAVWTARG